MGMKLTIKEAAKTVGMSEYALRQKIKMGLYPYLKIGIGRGRIFIDIDLLQQAIEKEQQDNMKQQRELYEQYHKDKHPEFNYMGSILGGR